MLTDKLGREYARLSALKEGDTIELDGGFTCEPSGQTIVYRDENGLFFYCYDGCHHLKTQADNGEDLIGIYPVDKTT